MHKDMSSVQKEHLVRRGYHVALLQEYCEKSTPFCDSTVYEEFHTWALQRMRTGEQCGTVVLLNREIKANSIKSWSFLSPDLEAIIRTPKSMTAVYFELPSSSLEPKRLLVVSIHGHNGWPWREAKPLERQLQQLKELLTQYQCPAVISGDFNTFTEPRREVVHSFMKEFGFTQSKNAPFDATRTLDYVFARGLTIDNFQPLWGLSDHPGMEFVITLR